MFLPLTAVVKNLLIINGLIFLCQMTFQDKFPIHEWFAQHHFLSKDFRPHQLLTAMFMHGSFGHLFGNMLFLYLFGTKLEMVWGPKRFLTFYLVCGIGAGLIIGLATLVETYPIISDLNLVIEHSTVKNFDVFYNKYGLFNYSDVRETYQALNANPGDPNNSKTIFNLANQYKDFVTSSSVIGASGAIYGLVVGAAYLFPNDIIFINFLFPVKLKWMALVYVGLELYNALQNAPGDQVAHVAHLGGALVGFLIVYFSYRRGNRRRLF